MSKAYNNFVHEVYLATPTPTTQSIPASMMKKPGIMPIPSDTQRLIFRIPNPQANMNERVRVQNEVAAMVLMRAALSATAFDKPLIPGVYGWSDNSNVNGVGWILQEFMPGETLDNVFKQFTIERQRSILSQIADVVRALQTFPLLRSVRGCGGVRFDSEGEVVSGAMSAFDAGPFDSAVGLYKAILCSQLAESDKSAVLHGWRMSGLRNSLEQFAVNGVDKIIAQALTEEDRLVLIHGDLCKSKNSLLHPTDRLRTEFKRPVLFLVTFHC